MPTWRVVGGQNRAGMQHSVCDGVYTLTDSLQCVCVVSCNRVTADHACYNRMGSDVKPAFTGCCDPKIMPEDVFEIGHLILEEGHILRSSRLGQCILNDGATL